LRAKRETSRGADGADLAEADFGNHALEAGALARRRRRSGQESSSMTSISDSRARQAVPHGVLQRAALAVVQHLMGRGLPHIKQRLALQMVRPILSVIMTGLRP